MSGDLPRSFKIVTFWLVLGALVFLGVQWQGRREQEARLTVVGDIVNLERARDGHYYWPGTLNGRRVVFLVDTGASRTAIPASLARELDLASEGEVRSNTAGGVVTGRLVRVDITLNGGVQARRRQAVALDGLGEEPLLGMDVLGRLRLEQFDGVLRIDLRPER
ncbi:retropepsin-like aspartic protease family protein [Piscinibacter koreensis]|uniref:Retroviral-like aspartic protease family protein n=1 Tax=Piscinibacter koreensis TaxID=2742824 RepID=A0A7Y6NJ91_9BURK|nr:retropepsin-like aspartic protease [Schlegelella koreensis]NUZ04193.1 retroviral-like aspartic protease family protein [Schlegelella koreensis]